jgi:hypothetical protein
MGVDTDQWGCAPYRKRGIDGKVGAMSVSGRDWPGAAIGSLGDCEGGWSTKLCNRHGLALSDITMT